MAFLLRLGTRYLSRQKPTPLPPKTNPSFQTWREFNAASRSWDAPDTTTQTGTPSRTSESLALTTWNIDYSSPMPESRIEAIVSCLSNLRPAIDIVFLQEVSGTALAFLLGDARVQKDWFPSETAKTIPTIKHFTTVTLLSKARFSPHESSTKAKLGPVWRVNYPSRYARDALCCDILLPSPQPTFPVTRIRLINVHLDSLRNQPSHRPEQLSIAATLLRSAGHGLVAGDFNPVLPEDSTLVEDNSLVDAWAALHPEDAGCTWGVDGTAPFPPTRLDKVAVLGLEAQEMEVLHPGCVEIRGAEGEVRVSEKFTDGLVPWSDHSGLWCTFKLPVSHQQGSDEHSG